MSSLRNTKAWKNLNSDEKRLYEDTYNKNYWTWEK